MSEIIKQPSSFPHLFLLGQSINQFLETFRLSSSEVWSFNGLFLMEVLFFLASQLCSHLRNKISASRLHFVRTSVSFLSTKEMKRKAGRRPFFSPILSRCWCSLFTVQFSYHRPKKLKYSREIDFGGSEVMLQCECGWHRHLLLSLVPRPQVVSVGCETSENHHQINLSTSRLEFRMQLKYK